MQWSEAIKEHIQSLQPVALNPALTRRLLGFIDFTNLNSEATQAEMALFFEKVQTPFTPVASVCVLPQFVRMAAAQFAQTSIKVGTVANFPEGTTPLEQVLIHIGRSLQDGAQEMDVVFPYQRYLAGERQYAHTFVESCKAICGPDVTLKVILETGVLCDPAIIADASYDVIAAGADFIKTSTGKVSGGATLEAAATMLLVIKHVGAQFNKQIGLKVSGGISQVQQAAQYVELADQMMGRDWLTTKTFRIGASRLIDQLLK